MAELPNTLCAAGKETTEKIKMTPKPATPIRFRFHSCETVRKAYDLPIIKSILSAASRIIAGITCPYTFILTVIELCPSNFMIARG